MAEATRNHDEVLLEQPILRSSSSTSITSSIIYDRDVLCNKIEALLDKIGTRNQASELLEECRSPSPESAAVTSSADSYFTSQIDGSFSEVETTDKAGTEDEKDIRYAVQESSQHCQAWHEADEDDGIKYIEHIHPVYRLNAMPYYAVRDHQGYGCFRTDRDSASYDEPSDKRSPEITARISLKQPLRPVWSHSITFKDLTGIRARAARNEQSNTTDKDSNSWVKPQYYLKLTDHFREKIEKGVAIYDGELSILLTAFQGILNLEILERSPPLSFPTIVYSRLDKLLKSIIHHPSQGKLISQASFNKLLYLAVAIESRWHTRFNDGLFGIDTERLSFMATHGILAHVSIKPSADCDGSASWVVDERWRGAGTDLLDFPLGHWWPNAECAIRDGAVKLTQNRAISGHQLVLYVFLLAGIESFDEELGWMKHTLQDTLENLFLHLHFEINTNIRLFRGYKLKSRNAPKIGVRYDGVYTLKRLVSKVIDPDTRQHRMIAYYDPVKDESRINNGELMKPSTRDDWKLYKSFEKAEMKRHCSRSGYYAWKTGEEQELRDCREWHRRENLRQFAENFHI